MTLFHSPSKKLRTIVATLFLGTTLATIALNPSTASAAPANCTQSHVICLFPDAVYKGKFANGVYVARFDFMKDKGCHSFISSEGMAVYNDKVSSVWVNYKQGEYFSAYVYKDAHCGASARILYTNVGPDWNPSDANYALGDKFSDGTPANDRVSSIRID